VAGINTMLMWGPSQPGSFLLRFRRAAAGKRNSEKSKKKSEDSVLKISSKENPAKKREGKKSEKRGNGCLKRMILSNQSKMKKGKRLEGKIGSLEGGKS